MSYYLSLFSPDTYTAFAHSSRTVAGFPRSKVHMAGRVVPGDKLICYMTKTSRFVGLFEVTSRCFEDAAPLFQPKDDPFCIRFHITPTVWLAPEQAIPIREPVCWQKLSFTRDLQSGDGSWTIAFRGGLKRFSDEDGAFLEELLRAQQAAPVLYPLSERDKRLLYPVSGRRGRGPAKAPALPVKEPVVKPAVPQTRPATAPPAEASESEHTRMQALLAEIGEIMHMKIWLPRADQQRVLAVWHPRSEGVLLERLPFNYNTRTMNTIENIDVLWVRNHSIAHAFEVEHTTSIYSGLLRMVDLMALQPNLVIKAHIVAADSRADKVKREIARPAFSRLEGGALANICSYMPYSKVYALRAERNLAYLNENVLEEYVEYTHPADF